MLTSNDKASGFTIVELAVVIVVLGVFLAIGVSSFRQTILNYQIRAQAESILNGLQLARSSAVQRNQAVQFVLSISGGIYDLGWRVQTEGGELIQTKSPSNLAGRITLCPHSTCTAYPLPGCENITTVTFSSLGRVIDNTPASNTMATIDVDVPSTIMPADESADLRIRILWTSLGKSGSGGLVKLCNPSVSAADDVRKCP